MLVLKKKWYSTRAYSIEMFLIGSQSMSFANPENFHKTYFREIIHLGYATILEQTVQKINKNCQLHILVSWSKKRKLVALCG